MLIVTAFGFTSTKKKLLIPTISWLSVVDTDDPLTNHKISKAMRTPTRHVVWIFPVNGSLVHICYSLNFTLFIATFPQTLNGFLRHRDGAFNKTNNCLNPATLRRRLGMNPIDIYEHGCIDYTSSLSHVLTCNLSYIQFIYNTICNFHIAYV